MATCPCCNGRGEINGRLDTADDKKGTEFFGGHTGVRCDNCQSFIGTWSRACTRCYPELRRPTPAVAIPIPGVGELRLGGCPHCGVGMKDSSWCVLFDGDKPPRCVSCGHQLDVYRNERERSV